MSYIVSQFGRPRGLVGWLAGAIMAYENRERNRWAVALLDIRPGDHILEVGFGPGLAIEQAAGLAVGGLVAGVDASEVMLRQARRRNAAAIRAGRVNLRLGSVASLPYADGAFDKAFAVNSLHHWPDPQRELKELWRVLRPGGLAAITEQPRGSATEAQVRETADRLATQLATAGFRQIRVESQPMQPATSICALGVK